MVGQGPMGARLGPLLIAGSEVLQALVHVVQRHGVMRLAARQPRVLQRVRRRQALLGEGLQQPCDHKTKKDGFRGPLPPVVCRRPLLTPLSAATESLSMSRWP